MGDNFEFLAPVYTTGISERTIERVIGRFRAIGFKSTGDDDTLIEYSLEPSDPGRESETPSRASTAVVENGGGTAYLSLDGFELELRFDLENASPAEPALYISGLEGAFGDDATESAVKRRSERLVVGVVGTTIETDPWGVVGTFFDEGPVVGVPRDPPPEATLSELPWVTVFGGEWCDQLGGGDRLRKTPAWNTRTLENGAVLIRKTELPDLGWAVRDAFSGEVGDPSDYVFEG